MTGEEWLMVKERFGECLSISPGERQEFLARQEMPPDVRIEVSRLLRNLEKVESGYLDPPEAVRRASPIAGTLLQDGDTLSDRYRIERFIGRGGMGEVYQAFDRELRYQVALKVLRPLGPESSAASMRLRRELVLARRVTHPSVCRLFDVNRHQFPWGTIEFLTMELLEGVTLAEILKQRGTLSPSEITAILREVLGGLHAMHAAGVVHRDLKPSNVMLMESSAASFRVSLMDFGLAFGGDDSSLTNSLTATGDVMGTLAYMAPEQFAGNPVTSATDYYAFGLIWYELFTGKRWFHATAHATPALGRAHPNSSPWLPRSTPRAWGRAIRSCLSVDPAQRPGFAELTEVLAASRKALPGGYEVARYIRLHRRGFLAGGAAALGLGGALSLFRGGLRLWNQSAALPEGALALVTPIANLTDESSLDAVTELVHNQLNQSVNLNLLGQADLALTLQRMGKSPPVSPENLREAGWRLNAALTVFGSASRVGADLVLNMQLETRGPEPGRPRSKLFRSFSAPDPPALMRAVHDACTWIRENIGESVQSTPSLDRLPADVTTPSWEALTFYARGERLSVQNRSEDALLMMESALQRDPQFTLAALRRADLLMNRYRQREGLAQWREAIGMLEKRLVTRREELNARGMFAYDTGDYAAADRAFATWALEYPNDPKPLIYRAGPLMLDGHADEARSCLERAAGMALGGAPALLQLIKCNLLLGDIPASRVCIDRFRKLGDAQRADLKEAAARYAELDFQGALNLYRSLRQNAAPANASAAAQQEALLLIEAGAAAQAAQRLEEFLSATSRSEHDPERSRLWCVLGWAHLKAARHEAATAAAAEALSLQSGHVILANAGTIFARARGFRQARRVLEDCAEFQDLRAYRITSLRIGGEIARASGRDQDGLKLLREAASLEPRITNREYLVEALDPADPERIGLCQQIVSRPWSFIRDTNLDAPGALATAIRTLLRVNPRDPVALRLQTALSAIKA